MFKKLILHTFLCIIISPLVLMAQTPTGETQRLDCVKVKTVTFNEKDKILNIHEGDEIKEIGEVDKVDCLGEDRLLLTYNYNTHIETGEIWTFDKVGFGAVPVSNQFVFEYEGELLGGVSSAYCSGTRYFVDSKDRIWINDDEGQRILKQEVQEAQKVKFKRVKCEGETKMPIGINEAGRWKYSSTTEKWEKIKEEPKEETEAPNPPPIDPTSTSSIPHKTNYEFGDKPFSVIVSASLGTVVSTADGNKHELANGNIISSIASGQTGAGWSLEVVTDPAGKDPGKYLCFSLQNTESSKELYLAKIDENKYVNKPWSTVSKEIQAETFKKIFPQYTHVIAAVRGANKKVSIYLNGERLSVSNTANSTANVTNDLSITVGGMHPKPVGGQAGPMVRMASLWNKALNQGEIINQMNYLYETEISPALNVKPKEGNPSYYPIEVAKVKNSYWFVGDIEATFFDIETREKLTISEIKEYDTELGKSEGGKVPATEPGLKKRAKQEAAEAAIAKARNPARYSYDSSSETITYKSWVDDNCIGFWDFENNGADLSTLANNTSKKATVNPVPPMFLPFYVDNQEQTNWCWAATGLAHNKFYNPSISSFSQCNAVAIGLPKEPGFTPPAGKNPCNASDVEYFNKGSWPAFAFSDPRMEYKALHNYDTGIQSISGEFFEEIKGHLKRRHVILVGVRKNRMDARAHWVTISGAYTKSGKNYLVLNDSFDGIVVVDCATFPLNYKPGDDVPDKTSDIKNIYITKLVSQNPDQ